MSVDLMLDLETLGTAEDAVVLAIGAVRFDPATWKVMWERDQFYEVLDVEDQLQRGRTVTVPTLLWWLGQPERARRAITHPERERVSLAIGLERLRGFVERSRVDRVWANGVTFDVSILNHAYRSTERDPPWRFSTVHDALAQAAALRDALRGLGR